METTLNGLNDSMNSTNSFIRYLIAYWLPPIVWMGLIFPIVNDAVSFNGIFRIIIPLLKWLSPEASRERVEFLSLTARKVGHFIEYSVLAWLLFRAVRSGSRRRRNWRWLSYSGVMAGGYAVFDEYAQSFVPARSASVSDVMLDAASVLTALVALSLLSRSQN